MTAVTRPNARRPLRVTREKVEGGVVGLVPDAPQDQRVEWGDAYLEAFGTKAKPVADRLLNQLLNATNDPSETSINTALAMVQEIAPADPVEAMLAVQMIGIHTAAMDAMRRSLHPDQSAEGRALYLGLAPKLTSTFAAHAEALNRSRGKTVTQVVRVEKVVVEDGGQAVVGAVAGRSGG